MKKSKTHPFVLGLLDSIMAMNLIRHIYKLLYREPCWLSLSLISFYFLLRLHDLWLLFHGSEEIHDKEEEE